MCFLLVELEDLPPAGSTDTDNDERVTAKGVLAMLEWQYMKVSDPSAFIGLCICLSSLFGEKADICDTFHILNNYMHVNSFYLCV